MCETCSVLGKVWKTISALISQQRPNMRSCFEPADRETHCWLSMIGADGLFNHFVLREDSASSSEICFESQVFEAGARSPQLELDKWDEDWSCEVFLTKCRPLVRDTPLARWFRLPSSWDRWVLKLREETSQGRSMSLSMLNLRFKLPKTQGGRGLEVSGKAKICPQKISQAHIC